VKKGKIPYVKIDFFSSQKRDFLMFNNILFQQASQRLFRSGLSASTISSIRRSISLFFAFRFIVFFFGARAFLSCTVYRSTVHRSTLYLFPFDVENAKIPYQKKIEKNLNTVKLAAAENRATLYAAI
jgi:hypothetical protein